ncbi:alpha/beta hydrolase [Cytophagales bacterium LB-30]|uniref:Alpha/beta hydrolase n=1 Tax=Shiella aurantiaca TaxID=3058365 RepID=A0ABT8F0Z7_9BACT|nr:alpha/beta fold hydrolase [Shiella aurantiaca]MDN4164110.1 alpha/beta hydrolase [Shiella aurantiaca]
MRNLWRISACLVLWLVAGKALAYETISFKSKDGVEMTADLYMTHPDTVPFIVLFHQAGSSRGEYLDIAPQLNQLGFNCLAVDLRSGKESNGVANKTNERARGAMKETSYLDALQDMEAALAHVRAYLAQGPVVLWGSSYSASLVFQLAATDSLGVAGVLAFSPGEYFTSLGKTSSYVQDWMEKVEVPVFITCARNEIVATQVLFDSIPTTDKTFYAPQTMGNHGAKALWRSFPDSREYWRAVKVFLQQWL